MRGVRIRRAGLSFWRRSSSTAIPPLGLLRLRSALDRRVLGHDDLKEALLLALVSKEHLYCEGPPGVAKTLLAESVAELTGLRTFTYQMHRDTRLHELVGDTVIVRQTSPDGGEVIRQSTRPGGILTADVAVLDDITRAPGFALNALFRVLNERRFSGGGEASDIRLPLVSAIATSNPAGNLDDGASYYVRQRDSNAWYRVRSGWHRCATRSSPPCALRRCSLTAARDFDSHRTAQAESLDPASLDRFALQVQVQGLVEGRSWVEAERLVEMLQQTSAADGCSSGGGAGTGTGGDERGADGAIGAAAEAATAWDDVDERTARMEMAAALRLAHHSLPRVVFGPEVASLLIGLLKRVTEEILQGAVAGASDGLDSFGGLDKGSASSRRPMLTDRTFLAKAPRLCKASAILAGRDRCEPDDLQVLRHMTAFRLPAELHAKLPTLIEEVIETVRREGGGEGGAATAGAGGSSAPNDGQQPAEGAPSGGGSKAGKAGKEGEEGEAGEAATQPTKASGGALADEVASGTKMASSGESLTSDGPLGGEDGRSAHGGHDAREQPTHKIEADAASGPVGAKETVEEAATKAVQMTAMLGALPFLAAVGAVEACMARSGKMMSAERQSRAAQAAAQADAHVLPLVAAVDKRFQAEGRAGGMRSRSAAAAARTSCPGGNPVAWRAAPSLAELEAAEADATDAALWAADPAPSLPHCVLRWQAPPPTGGRIAILRDVSASMHGARSAWTSAVVAAVIRLCQARSLSVTLLEFNHTIISPAAMSSAASSNAPSAPPASPAATAATAAAAAAAASSAASFTRDYGWLCRAASRQWSDGGTNLQLALSTAIGRFCEQQHGAASASRHEIRHALLVTDGISTVGDPTLAAERSLAQRLKLRVHTVYVNGHEEGSDEVELPPALVQLARATGGLACSAVINDEDGSVRLKAM